MLCLKYILIADYFLECTSYFMCGTKTTKYAFITMFPWEKSKGLFWQCSSFLRVSKCQAIGFLNEQFNPEDSAEVAKVWPPS